MYTHIETDSLQIQYVSWYYINCTDPEARHAKALHSVSESWLVRSPSWVHPSTFSVPRHACPWTKNPAFPTSERTEIRQTRSVGLAGLALWVTTDHAHCISTSYSKSTCFACTLTFILHSRGLEHVQESSSLDVMIYSKQIDTYVKNVCVYIYIYIYTWISMSVQFNLHTVQSAHIFIHIYIYI